MFVFHEARRASASTTLSPGSRLSSPERDSLSTFLGCLRTQRPTGLRCSSSRLTVLYLRRESRFNRPQVFYGSTHAGAKQETAGAPTIAISLVANEVCAEAPTDRRALLIPTLYEVPAPAPAPAPRTALDRRQRRSLDLLMTMKSIAVLTVVGSRVGATDQR